MSPQPKPGEGLSNKRRRELARAKEARQVARRAEKTAARKRRTILTAGLAALIAVVVALVVVLWPEPEDELEEMLKAAQARESATASPSLPAASASALLANCKDAPKAQANPKTYKQAPQQQLVAGTDYKLVLETNCGDIKIATLPTKAPKTVNSMLWLAQQGYFDQTACHRLTTSGIYVLQCGDPTGTGTGNPGYKLPDENLPKEGGVAYPAGTVAMANAGAGTSGSQFFIVYKDTLLPSSYTVWGKVTEGLEIVSAVASAGAEGGKGDGAPVQAIGIVTATPKPALPA